MGKENRQGKVLRSQKAKSKSNNNQEHSHISSSWPYLFTHQSYRLNPLSIVLSTIFTLIPSTFFIPCPFYSPPLKFTNSSVSLMSDAHHDDHSHTDEHAHDEHHHHHSMVPESMFFFKIKQTHWKKSNPSLPPLAPLLCFLVKSLLFQFQSWFTSTERLLFAMRLDTLCSLIFYNTLSLVTHSPSFPLFTTSPTHEICLHFSLMNELPTI